MNRGQRGLEFPPSLIPLPAEVKLSFAWNEANPCSIGAPPDKQASPEGAHARLR